MNSAVVRDFAAPPRYEIFADPVPGAEEALVRVSAAGLHPIVKALAAGTHYGATAELPFIPGIDGVGKLEDGTRVYFGMSRPPFGTFAERCVTARALCFPIPDHLDDAAVAAMINPGMSSWAALSLRAQFTAGESVLILGATGVAGQLAAQVARRLGAKRIIAAGRNPAGLKEVEHLGADEIISLADSPEALSAKLQKEFSAGQIDVVLDYLWGNPAERVMQAISQRGLHHKAGRIRYLQIGSSAGPSASVAAETLRSSGLELLGSGFGSVSMERIFASLREFLQEAARNPVQIKTKAVPLRDVETLWNATEPGVRLVFRP